MGYLERNTAILTVVILLLVNYAKGELSSDDDFNNWLDGIQSLDPQEPDQLPADKATDNVRPELTNSDYPSFLSDRYRAGSLSSGSQSDQGRYGQQETDPQLPSQYGSELEQQQGYQTQEQSRYPQQDSYSQKSRYPQQESQQSLYPQQESQQSLYPQQESQKSLYPQQESQQSLYPQQESQQSLYPQQESQQSLYPQQESQQSLYPQQESQQSLYPQQESQQSLYPQQESQQSLYPQQESQQSLYPQQESQQSLYPQQESQQSLYPQQELQQSVYPQQESQQSLYPQQESYSDSQRLTGQQLPEEASSDRSLAHEFLVNRPEFGSDSNSPYSPDTRPNIPSSENIDGNSLWPQGLDQGRDRTGLEDTRKPSHQLLPGSSQFIPNLPQQQGFPGQAVPESHNFPSKLSNQQQPYDQTQTGQLGLNPQQYPSLESPEKQDLNQQQSDLLHSQFLFPQDTLPLQQGHPEQKVPLQHIYPQLPVYPGQAMAPKGQEDDLDTTVMPDTDTATVVDEGTTPDSTDGTTTRPPPTKISLSDHDILKSLTDKTKQDSQNEPNPTQLALDQFRQHTYGKDSSSLPGAQHAAIDQAYPGYQYPTETADTESETQDSRLPSYPPYNQAQQPQYDSYGRLVNPESSKQQYDSHGRLIKPESGKQPEYDAYGRLTNPETGKQPQYDSYGRLVNPETGKQPQYDSYGRLINPESGKKPQYDAYGRLITSAKSDELPSKPYGSQSSIFPQRTGDSETRLPGSDTQRPVTDKDAPPTHFIYPEQFGFKQDADQDARLQLPDYQALGTLRENYTESNLHEPPAMVGLPQSEQSQDLYDRVNLTETRPPYPQVLPSGSTRPESPLPSQRPSGSTYSSTGLAGSPTSVPKDGDYEDEDADYTEPDRQGWLKGFRDEDDDGDEYTDDSDYNDDEEYNKEQYDEYEEEEYRDENNYNDDYQKQGPDNVMTDFRHQPIKLKQISDGNMSLIVFYTWLGVVSFMVIIAFVVIKHRQKLVNMVWQRANYRRHRGKKSVEEGHTLLLQPNV